MKKCAVLLILPLLFITLTGCGGNIKRDIDLNVLGGEITANAGFSDITDSMQLLYDYYSISEEDIEDAYFYRDASGAVPDEIAIFKASSQEAAARIEEACRERKNDLTDRFKDYRPLEMPKINSAVIYTESNYIMFVICDDSDKARDLFKDGLK